MFFYCHQIPSLKTNMSHFSSGIFLGRPILAPMHSGAVPALLSGSTANVKLVRINWSEQLKGKCCKNITPLWS